MLQKQEYTWKSQFKAVWKCTHGSLSSWTLTRNWRVEHSGNCPFCLTPVSIPKSWDGNSGDASWMVLVGREGSSLQCSPLLLTNTGICCRTLNCPNNPWFQFPAQRSRCQLQPYERNWAFHEFHWKPRRVTASEMFESEGWYWLPGSNRDQ